MRLFRRRHVDAGIIMGGAASDAPRARPNMFRRFFDWRSERSRRGNELKLIAAARNGEVRKVCDLLDFKRVNVDAVNEQGETALHWAAYGCHATVVTELLNRRADPRKQDNSGGTALSCTSDFAVQAILRRAMGIAEPEIAGPRDRASPPPLEAVRLPSPPVDHEDDFDRVPARMPSIAPSSVRGPIPRRSVSSRTDSALTRVADFVFGKKNRNGERNFVGATIRASIMASLAYIGFSMLVSLMTLAVNVTHSFLIRGTMTKEAIGTTGKTFMEMINSGYSAALSIWETVTNIVTLPTTDGRALNTRGIITIIGIYLFIKSVGYLVRKVRENKERNDRGVSESLPISYAKFISGKLVWAGIVGGAVGGAIASYTAGEFSLATTAGSAIGLAAIPLMFYGLFAALNKIYTAVSRHPRES